MAQPTGEPNPTPGAPAPGAPPAPTATPPPAFDPSTLSPEAKAYLDGQVAAAQAAADLKARTQSKANAAAEEQARIMKVMQDAGLLPGGVPSDPAAVAAQLATIAQANADLMRTQAIERAAWQAKADPERVAAMLNHQGRLKDLDPAAPDFGAVVKALVEESIAANPWMKLEVAPATPPPAANGTAGVGNAAPPAERQRGFGAVVAAHYGAKGNK